MTATTGSLSAFCVDSSWQNFFIFILPFLLIMTEGFRRVYNNKIDLREV
jgi:hypothetical protein